MKTIKQLNNMNHDDLVNYVMYLQYLLRDIETKVKRLIKK